ncbi:multidrug effflux MFS transporter [Roseicitreum antarcticum]|uniref:Bcr/CflA family efflux transporter n=1 Tax=Roseicitreum antarcticum TaxID=564137 RepID=A0A1H2VYJ8_9RHOB|nr:multidrug effflux MFS transporter [Roseicitreum antarcticum]SDW73420.1 MFS transporter, DHA1 family, bicyclomycin/chloramphenicol resistance protein [Roseicitreum antarcticum]
MITPPPVRFLDRTTPPHIMTLVLLSGLGALAMNVFLPSLPNMTAYFDTEYRVMQLSVSLYLAMNALLQLFIGPVADRFGRRPVLLGALGIFLVATVGTLLAQDITTFLICRMGQAAVVATLVLSRAVIRDMVDASRSASMIGYVTMGMAVVPMVAPVFGGMLDAAFGWQASFVLMLVAGLAIFALTWADLGETFTRSEGGFRAQVQQYPDLLTSPRFWGYCMTAMLASGAFFAYLGGAPFVGSQVFGLNPAQLGLYFGAPAVGYAVGNFVSGRYSVRMGINRMALIGTLLCFSGMAALGITFALGAQTPQVFYGFFIFVGLGNGMVLPNATAGMLSVRPHLAGSASGLGGAIMIGGGAALSALAGALLTPGSGAWPLIYLLMTTSALAILPVLYVMRRERALARGAA